MMADFTIPTDIGLQKIMAAVSGGDPVALATFKVGDGGGSEYDPTPAQLDLVNTVYSGSMTPGAVYIDPDNPKAIIIEHTIPNTSGGYTIREAGVFDADGNMIVVAKIVPTDKPIYSSGSTRQTMIRLVLAGVNKDDLDVIVSAAPQLATMQWVIDNFIPSGTSLDGYLKVDQGDARYLKQDSNGGDIPDAEAFRENLGVPYADNDEAAAGTEQAKVLSPATGVHMLRNTPATTDDRGSVRWSKPEEVNAGVGDGSISSTMLMGLMRRFFVGMVADFAINGTVQKGWLRLDGTSIGNVGSGASQRANADCWYLYEYLWNNTRPQEWLMQSSTGGTTAKGSSAAADWSAGKRIVLVNQIDCFRRSVGFQRFAGSFQADALQNITGEFPLDWSPAGDVLFNGAIYKKSGPTPSALNAGGGTQDYIIGFDASRVARTDNETRPKNIAYGTFIFGGVNN